MEPSSGGLKAIIPATRMVFMVMVILLACHKRAANVKVIIAKTAVSQQPKSVVNNNKKPKKKKIYLTFDDGPNKGTRNVLKIVQDEKVPVSFFIVGEHVFASSDQKKSWDSLSIAEHIALCNHSYSHAHNKYASFYENADSVVRDFSRTRDSLHLNNNIVRTPGRNIWRIDSLRFTDLKRSTAAADSLQRAGFIVMGWDVEWHYDHKSMSVTSTADEMIKDIDSAFSKNKTRLQDHLVLLAHDQVYHKSDDSMQLRKFLQKLKLKKEYELSIVTTYPASNRQDTFKVKSVQ